MNSLTLAKRLALASLSIGTFMLVMGLVALWGLHSMQGDLKAISEDAVSGLSTCSRLEATMLEMRGDVLKHIGSTSSEDEAATQKHIQGLEKQLASDLSAVQSGIENPEEREIVARIPPLLTSYIQHWENNVRPLSEAGHNAEAYAEYRRSTDIYQELRAAIGAESDYHRRLCQKLAERSAATSSRVQWTTWLCLAAGLLLGSGTMYFVGLSIHQTLGTASEELKHGADQVASAAAQVASSAQHLAQGANEQASSIEETSASTEEISSMTHKNRDNAAQASQLMLTMMTQVNEGNQRLSEMLASMKEINNSSEQIAKILKTIDEIAFQTNILALNAAVEAARAGESGQGFAVVADEVRNLAQRCAQASSDTAALIESSIQSSHAGGRKLDEVTRSIGAITDVAGKANVLIQEVHVGSEEQARGLEQIATAMSQMEQVTQRNAANAEQSAAASEELTAQAHSMRGIVSGLEQIVGASA